MLIFTIMELVDIFGFLLISFLFTGVTTFYRNFLFLFFSLNLIVNDKIKNHTTSIFSKNNLSRLLPPFFTFSIFKINISDIELSLSFELGKQS